MFKSKTVFILGAGSSKEIGLPLGSDLKVTIAEALKFKFDHFQAHSSTGDSLVCEALRKYARRKSGDQRAIENEILNRIFSAAAKISRGMSQAISIDNYLEAHADDDDIVICGKLAIARAILIAEASSWFRMDQDYPDRFDHARASSVWYGKLFQLLAMSVPKTSLESLLKNVSFVTFNYDRSFERFLPSAIDNYYHCGLDRAYELMRGVKVFHPYGICGSLPWQGSEAVPYGGSEYSPELLSVADKIQTFSEQVTDEKSMEEIKTEIETAKTLVFLGFGFHEMNMNLLSVPNSKVSRVFGTAHGLSSSDVAVVTKRILQAINRDATHVELRNDLKCSQLFEEYRFSLIA